MKIRSRKLLLMASVAALVCGALGLPRVVKYYNDKQYIDKIQYVARKDIDVFRADTAQSMTDKMGIISNFLEKGEAPGILQLPYEPNEEQETELNRIIMEQIKLWFFSDRLGMDLIGLDLNIEDGIYMKSIDMYSVYESDNFSYFVAKVVPKGDENLLLTLYIDSTDYKIYLMTMEGKTVYKWSKDNEMKGNEMWMLLSTTSDFEKNLSAYYGLEQESVNFKTDTMCRTYLLGEAIEWNIELNIKNNKLYIGIKDFENGFANIDITNSSVDAYDS